MQQNPSTDALFYFQQYCSFHKKLTAFHDQASLLTTAHFLKKNESHVNNRFLFLTLGSPDGSSGSSNAQALTLCGWGEMGRPQTGL